MAHQLTGTVRRFDNNRGFGFVEADDGGDDLFLHASQFIGPVTPVRGMRVRFTVGVDKLGRPRAQRVSRIA